MRARSEHLRERADKCAVKATAAQGHWTRASFEAERKQLLILAQQAPAGGGASEGHDEKIAPARRAGAGAIYGPGLRRSATLYGMTQVAFL